MARLELTTTLRGVSSSPRARAGLTAGAAAGRAKASARYTLRDAAAEPGNVAWAGPRLDDCENRHAARLAFGQAAADQAAKGGKVGRRLSSSLIVSVPNEWPPEARADALRRLTAHLAPAGSEACAIGAIHTDKPGNTHMHFVVVDGLEPIEAARKRADERRKGMDPDAAAKVRVRRRNALRLNELGRPKELRRELAGLMNEVAKERGLRGVEWRSFEERGIAKNPTTHDGPHKRARKAKAQKTDGLAFLDSDPDAFDAFAQEAKTVQPAPVPKPLPALHFEPDQRPPELPYTPKVRDPEARSVKLAAAKARLAPAAPPEQTKKVFRGGRWLTVKVKPDGDER
jgi:MobA/MobL family